MLNNNTVIINYIVLVVIKLEFISWNRFNGVLRDLC